MAALLPAAARPGLLIGLERGNDAAVVLALPSTPWPPDPSTCARTCTPMPRMRPGGIILVDNTLLHGRIFEPSPDPDAQAIKEFNEHVLRDDRVELVMLPVGDGLTMARAR